MSSSGASCLIFSRTVAGTGNLITAQRIAQIFRKIGFTTELCSSDEYDKESAIEIVSKQSVKKIYIFF